MSIGMWINLFLLGLHSIRLYFNLTTRFNLHFYTTSSFPFLLIQTQIRWVESQCLSYIYMLSLRPLGHEDVAMGYSLNYTKKKKSGAPLSHVTFF